VLCSQSLCFTCPSTGLQNSSRYVVLHYFHHGSFALFGGKYRLMLRLYCSPNAIYISLLLLLGGIESNPGLAIFSASLKLGVFNIHSVVHKSPLTHVITADRHLHLLVVMVTWMKLVKFRGHHSGHSAWRLSRDPSSCGSRRCGHGQIKVAAVPVSTAIKWLGQLTFIGDFNCPGDGTRGVGSQLMGSFTLCNFLQ
jgi:hypothetical protein